MLVTGLAFVLNYVISLVLTPYITENVGIEAYGYVSFSKNCTQYMAIITLALNSYASRYISLEYHKGNVKGANVLYSSVFYGNLGLGSILLAAGLVASIFLDELIVIPAGLTVDVKLLFIFVFAGFWVTTLGSAYESAAYVSNRLDVSGRFKGLSYLAEAVVLIVLFMNLPDKVWYVGVGILCASLVVTLSNVWLSKKYAPELVISGKDFAVPAVKRLVFDGIWASANSLGDMLNTGLDLMVCNLMLTPVEMGQVAIVKTMDNLFHAIYYVIGRSFQPTLLKTYAGGDKKALLGALKFSMKISGMVANIAFAGFTILGMVYYRLWIPNQDIGLIYNLTVITIAVSVVTGAMFPLYYIYTLTLKKEFPCFVTLLGGSANLVGMIISIHFFNAGVYAVVLSTTIVMFVINFVTNPLYMAHSLKIPWNTFYPDLLENIVSALILLGVYRLLYCFYKPSGWLGLVMCAGVYTIVGAPIHAAVVFRGTEWNPLWDKVKNKLKRK